MILIDKYAYTNKLLNVNSHTKCSIGAIFLFASMITHNLIILIGIMLLMSFAIVGVAKIDIKSYIRLLKIPIYFLIIGVGLNLINISFNSKDMIYSLNIFALYLGVSIESINTSAYILCRAMSCLTCVYFIVLTTPFNQLLYLLKELHVPDTIVELSMLIYRFIFIFLEEVSDIKKAQELRFGYIDFKTSYKSLGLLGNLLFKRMMMRYDDMCISLDMKLYDGKFHIIGDKNV